MSSLQTVVLPNGTAWNFQYSTDGYGDLTQITLPTGGTISYTWTGGGMFDCNGANPAPRVVATRSVSPSNGAGQPPTWIYTWLGNPTVVDPLGNDTVYTYTTFGQCQNYIASTSYYQGSTTLLKTVSTSYHSDPSPFGPSFGEYVMNVVPTQTKTSWYANGATMTSQTSKTYDYNNTGFQFTVPGGYSGTYNGLYGKVTNESDYDYGGGGNPGSVLRETNTFYEWQSSSNYLNNNMLNLVYSTQITDANNNQKAYTWYGYDEGTLTTAPNVSQNLDSYPWTGSLRGNQTSVHRWLDGSTASTNNCPISVSNGYLTSYTGYYNTGEVYEATEACGSALGDPLHTTTYLYSSAFQGAYLTQATNPFGQNTSYGYDINSGLKTSTIDANNQPTSWSYDIDWRLTNETRPDRGQTNFCYTDLDQGGNLCKPSSGPFQVVITKAITSPSANLETATAIVDGLGRLTQTQLNSDPDGVTYTDTTYDALGRKSTVSNPYRSTTDPTYGLTAYIYDGLSRVCVVVQPDGTAVPQTSGCPTTAPSGDVFTQYAGNCTTVTDEAGNSRQSCVDGLGRMTSVLEDPGSTSHLNYRTLYAYDALNNLTNVTQNGSNSANARTRSFGYDSLSHLASANNPESGTISYAYDADGNVITKTSPAPNQTTGTATVTINYAYDRLNRLTQKAYSGVTLQYGYDGTALSGCGAAPPAINSPTNLIARRSSMCSGLSASSWSYDQMGRPLLESRTNLGAMEQTCTGAGRYRACTKSDVYNFTVGYSYNLDGSLGTLTYPSGDVVTYTVGGAGRATQAVDSNKINYVGNTGTAGNTATYAPHGALASMTNGFTSIFAGIATSNGYNNRLQPGVLFAASPSQTIFSLSYGFNPGSNNGNVAQIVNNLDATRSVAFTYDALNRISQATTSNCWGEAYTIDAWGNLTNINPAPGVTWTCNNENVNFAPANGQNHLTSISYDIAGNVINDGNGNQPTYDAENTMATDAGVTYDYDADGERVEKSSGTMYWPGPSGTLAETDLSGNINEEYIYFNGTRIARVDRPSGTVHYYFSNHLGSHTMVTSATGSCEQDIDYYPYGGIVNDYCPTVAQHYKFTGKERDSESGLDMFGARYYGSSMGRFMVPDWAAKPTNVPYASFGNPQSLNLYSYVENNPTTTRDPDGHGDAGTFCNTQCRYGTPVSDAEIQVDKGILELSAAALAGPEVLAAAAEATTVLQTLAVTTAVVGTTGTAVNGTVDIVGGLTHTNVDAGTNAVTAVTNPVAGAVSLATGSMEKGSQAADLTTVVKAGVNLATGKGMSNPAEVGSSLAGARNAVTGAVATVKSVISGPPAPPPPPTPKPPSCASSGSCN
ncbi:MAG: RHS repeat-associated core domain-containing protein [Terriglobales bacterium]